MFKKGNKANVSLNKNVTIRFESWKNADAFNKFHFELATNLVKKLSSAPNKYNSGTNKIYYTSISNNKRNKYHLFNVSKDPVLLKYQ